MVVGQLNKMKKVVIINFFLILIIIISLELVVRSFQLSQLMGIESSKLYNLENDEYKFKSNTSGLVFNKIIYTDYNGFRVPNLEHSYKNNSNSIIFFGDSVAFGNGVEEQKTFIGLLRQSFKETNFYNLSLPGYQIDSHLKNVKYLNKFNNIKRAFYVFTLNDIDISNNLEGLTKDFEIKEGEFNFINSIKKNIFFSKLNAFLRDKSYLYNYLKGISSDPSARWFKYDYNLFKNEKLLENFELFIDKFVNQISDKEVEFSVIILPYEFQTRKNNCNYELLMPQSKIKKILEKKDIKFYDLTNEFCNQLDAKALYYKFDPMHLSEKGHFIVFNYLNEKIFN